MKLKATYTRRILAMMYFPDCEPANTVRRRYFYHLESYGTWSITGTL